LKVLNLSVENKYYLFRLAWNFTYSDMPWSTLMCAKFLKSKYLKVPSCHSSSIWPNMNEYYNIVLENTFYTTGRGDWVNF